MQEASIREQSIADLFSDNLNDTPCVFIDHDREVWLATEMYAEYTESSVDQIVVVDKNNIVGTLGGYDLLAYVRKYPTRKFQYESKVENIMFSPVLIIDKSMKFRDLMEKCIPEELSQYFVLDLRVTGSQSQPGKCFK
jgi:predicted transcriptional regulator